jgi:NhaP-type Na+/H+ and K+/H+ antiporter
LANLAKLECAVPWQKTFLTVLCAALTLPIVSTVLVGLGRLLAAMGDTAGAAAVDRFALAAGVLWVLALIALVLLLAATRALEPPHDEIDEQ